MYKNVIISVLAAELILKQPWFIECAGSVRMAEVVGTATVVFIFLLFLEEKYENWQIRLRRRKQVQQIVKALQEGATHGRKKHS